MIASLGPDQRKPQRANFVPSRSRNPDDLTPVTSTVLNLTLAFHNTNDTISSNCPGPLMLSIGTASIYEMEVDSNLGLTCAMA